VQTFVAAEKQ